MKVSTIVSMILTSLVVLIQHLGVLSSPTLRGSTSREDEAVVTTGLSMFQKYRDWIVSIQSRRISTNSLPNNIHKSPSQMTVRNLPGKKKDECPAFLKNPRKAMAYSFCQKDGPEDSPMAPFNCLLYDYDGVTVPDFDVEEPIMAFEGISSNDSLLTGVFINIPSGNFSNPDSVPYLILSQSTGLLSVQDGGISDFPISQTYSVPFGKNLCGVDKIKYVHVESTANQGEAVVTFY